MKENAETLNNNALHLIKKGNVDDAIELLKRAVTIEPENQTIWFNLGITLRDDGNFEEARHALETAHMLDPDNTEIIDTLAITCMNGEDMDAALSYCAEGLEKNELDAHLWNTFGVLYFNKNELDLAAEAFEHAITLNPYYYDALFNLRDTYEEMGNEAGKKECTEQMKNIKQNISTGGE
ncbi:MAG: tetratricopeptide repeat protein [Treponema sp.]|nr:tetratricopeptide repeat protein [Treponema sp.]